MPRPRRDILRTNITLEAGVMSELELYLMDSTRVPPRPMYGALSTVVNNLLKMFLVEVRKPNADPVELFRKLGVDLQKHTKEKNDG